MIRRLLYFIIIIILISSCNKKFDKQLWGDRKDPEFPPEYRNAMLNDLTTNYKLIGISYSELIDLLGNPDDKDSSLVSYDIIVDYGWDIDPVHIKNLKFYMKDSNIVDWEIYEWKH